MADLLFKQGNLSNISSIDKFNGAVYFSKDDTSGHSAHGYIFYDDEIDRIPINGSGYYMAPDRKNNVLKSMFIENNLFNSQVGATIGVGYNDKELWLHKSSSSTSINRGLWSPLFSTSDTEGAWILKLGAGVGSEQGEYTYIGSPSYTNNDGTSSNNKTIRPMERTGYSLGDSIFPWATAHITEMTGNASTATTLKTARNFQVGEGDTVSFNGSANVKIPLAVSAAQTKGDTAGPKLTITVNGVTSDTIAINSASTTQSGVVTTSSQTFVGDKTFANNTTYFRMTNQDKWGSISPFNKAFSSIATEESENILPGIILTAHSYGQITSSTSSDWETDYWQTRGIDRIVLSSGTNAAFYPTSTDDSNSQVNRISLGCNLRRWENLYVKAIFTQSDRLLPSTDLNIYLGDSSHRWSRVYTKAFTVHDEYIIPTTNDAINFGTNSFRWKNIYAINGNFTDSVYTPTAIGETQGTSSDSRLKIVQSNNILEKDLLIYNQLQPIVYKYKDVLSTENHSRTHIGFLAQDVEMLINQNGLTSEDCALVQIENLEEDSEYLSVCSDGKKYYLNYNELHGLHTLKNQQQDARLAELETKNQQLENTISELKTQIELLKLAIGG